MCLILHELGHLQPPMSFHCDNLSMLILQNNTIKKQQSWLMEMVYLWIADQVNCGTLTYTGIPDSKILPIITPSIMQ